MRLALLTAAAFLAAAPALASSIARGTLSGMSAKSIGPSPCFSSMLNQRSAGPGSAHAMSSTYAPSSKTTRALCDVRPG